MEAEVLLGLIVLVILCLIVNFIVGYERQDSLLKKVQEGNDWETRKHAFNKLNSASLQKIATSTEDKAMEIAAKILLGQTNWQYEFCDTSRAHLSNVIGAVALVKHPEPTMASIVKACHLYIKRGEIHRIPELRDLLLRFGDKELAEDYLNCGNDQLREIGGEWCRMNGYDIGSGWGSHRVQWGEWKV